MIAEKLRKSILQAAIQGKLTEQLPEDGDARDLLEAIKAEKARLMKEGKIKKETQLPEITEEEIPFDIPENWCWVRLPEIGELARGKSKHRPRNDSVLYENGCYPMVQTGDVARANQYISTYTACYNEVGLAQSRLWNKGTLCLTIAANIGDVAILTFDACFPDSVVGFNAFLPIESNVYFLYMLSAYKQQLDNLSRSTAQKNINLEILASVPIPLPPLAEQQRIVVAIEEAFEKIKDLEKDELKLDLLQKSFPKRMKDSLLQAAIQGKLTEQRASDGDARALVADIQKEKERLIKEGKIKKERVLPEITEDEIPFDIPDSWCWVRLGEVTDYGTGKQVNQNNIAPNSWILELEDIEKETYKLSSKRFDRKPGSSKNAFTAGDILYGKLRPYLKKVIIADESGYCSTEIIPFRGYGNINSSYLKYCMVAPTIDSYINQITHGMDMPRLGTDKAKQLVIPLPPLDEQQRIVARLELLLPLCDALE